MPRVSIMIKALALALFAACAYDTAAALSDKCKAKDSNLGKRIIDCYGHGYACNIADLSSSGSVIANRRADGGPCTVTIDNVESGFFRKKSYTRCKLEVSGTVTLGANVGASLTGPSVTVSGSKASPAVYEYKNNCAAWCGNEKYTPNLDNTLYTFVRCYDNKNCKNSKCLKRDFVGFNWWY